MLSQQEFATRRQGLLDTMRPDSVAILMGNNELSRNGDAHYRFRQDSHFHYLTGFDEPDAWMVLVKQDNNAFHLFNRPKDPEQEIWHGLRAGQEGACTLYGADEAYPVEKLDALMPQLLLNKHTIYYCHGHRDVLDKKISQWCQHMRSMARKGIEPPQTLINLDNLLGEMRLIKSMGEQNIMRHVAQLSAAAHINAMKACKQVSHEYQLEAVLMQEFLHHGCRAPAYDPIVGSGENSCILHYTENKAPLQEGELVLIDAGGEYANYAADITRTFPVSGRFNPEQKAIYNLVLKAQLAGIECIKPGAPWPLIQETMVKIISQGLIDLGLLSGLLEEVINTHAYRQFYMHNSGHWLGLDVHDVGPYKQEDQWRHLKAGMILTVEPGIYIQKNPNIDEKWHNIGVRIEDDILVTEDGHENLSEAAPKSIDAIEALMNDD